MNIKLTKKDKVKVLNSDDVFGIMQRILLRENKIDRDKEHFWLIGLNVANKLLFIELVSIGGTKSSTIEPMTVFRLSVMKNTAKVVLVHNHPSEELKPSIEDKKVTDRLIQVGRILGIEVIDHLIISTTSYLSFTDIGLLKELMDHSEWIPNFELEEKILKEQLEIRKLAVKEAREQGEKKGERRGEKRGVKKGLMIGVEKGVRIGEMKGVKIGVELGEKQGREKEKYEMAKALKRKGVDLAIIMETSGLSKEEIEKL